MSTRAPTMGTLNMARTRLTDSLRKSHANDRFAMPIGNDAPRLPGLRSWASHLLSLPINVEVAVIKAKSLLRLPTHLWRYRPDDLHLRAALTLGKHLRIDIAHIHQMLIGKQL